MQETRLWQFIAGYRLAFQYGLALADQWLGSITGVLQQRHIQTRWQAGALDRLLAGNFLVVLELQPAMEMMQALPHNFCLLA